MTSIPQHRAALISIIKDVYQHKEIAPRLGFKGGTCLYFLHSLPRFSTDLDFDYLPEDNAFDRETFRAMLEKHLVIKDEHDKRYTWFWSGTAEGLYWKLKVEVNKRKFPNTYEVRDFFGISITALTLPCILAHKLCAITDRSELANRDLFDVHWLLKQNTPIEDDIVFARMGKDTASYLRDLIAFISEQVSKRGPLNGLGELVEPELKGWIKEHLVKELLFYLRLYEDVAAKK